MVRIKDIARIAGVSPTTVSNVIHGNTKRVSTDTVEKIQTILKECDYESRLSARYNKHHNSNIIGVIITYASNRARKIVEDPFISGILGALEEDIRNKGYFMMLYAAEETIEIFKLASTWNVAGLVILGFTERDCVNLKKQTDTPFVTIDCYFEKYKGEFINVGLADFDGGYRMGSYLAQMGHSKILYLADDNQGEFYHRFLGFKSALMEQGISCNEQNFILLEIIDDDRKKQYINLLECMKRNTALFFASDYYAVECINQLKEQGILVPEDISVTGFDDNIFALTVSPKLTTIHQDTYKKANLAVEKLFYLIEGKEERISERDSKLPVHLVCRDSVADIS